MIDREAFKRAWAGLCARFGQADDAQQMAAYYEYLSEQMDTPAFLASARALWATNRFFPRPADFLLVQASGDWALVLKAIEGHAPPDWKWVEPWNQMSKRGRQACKHLGGIEGMKQLREKDGTIRLKNAWEQAYEQTTAAEVLQLGAGGAKLLRSA